MLEALADVATGKLGGSDFERLNNAIVAAGNRGGGWSKLADDWNTNVFQPRAYKMLLPPLWSSLLNEYWTHYTKLYLADPNRGGLPEPQTIAPGGLSSAIRAFYAPALDALKNLLPSEPSYKPPPVAPGTPDAGPVKRLVADLQLVLIALGWRSTTIPRPTAKDFGLYGPKTANAWKESAQARGLPIQFDRSSPTEAVVDARTLRVLTEGKSIPIGPKPTPDPVPEPVPPVEEGMSPLAVALIGIGVVGVGYTLWKRKRGRSPSFATT
jgi:hypothetical protein